MGEIFFSVSSYASGCDEPRKGAEGEKSKLKSDAPMAVTAAGKMHFPHLQRSDAFFAQLCRFFCDIAKDQRIRGKASLLFVPFSSDLPSR